MSTLSVRPAWLVDGWAGNYVDDNGVDWVVYDDKGWFEPVGVRLFDADKPAGNGTYSSPNLDSSRVITLTGYARAPDPVTADKARNQFSALCRRGHLHQLLVEEPVVNKTAYVKWSGGNVQNTRPNQFEFQLILVAPDPRKYSALVHTKATKLAQDAPGGIQWNGPAGGTGVQWNGPAGGTGVQYQTGAGANGVIELTNDGTADTSIVFNIAGPVTNPIIVRTDTGETLAWNGTVSTGSVLQIDTGTGAVLLNGGNQRPLLTSADFFVIPGGDGVTPGAINVAFNAPAPSPTAELTAVWSDAWY
jgi:hypothetical protein